MNNRLLMQCLLSTVLIMFSFKVLALNVSDGILDDNAVNDTTNGIVNGRLKTIDFSPHEHHPLRVFMAVPMAMCGPDTLDWAYAKSHYTVFMNLLLTAKAAGFSVELSSQLDGEGFCEIQSVRIN